MKTLKFYLLIGLGIFLLVGCSSQSSNNPRNETIHNESALEFEKTTNKSNSKVNQQEENDKNQSDELTEIGISDSDNQSTPGGENAQIQQEESQLSAYSTEEIEYARIWLQLGPNQEIEELTVQKIKAGTLINPNDETSAIYPEDVIQLTGSRLVDGSITYSSNGNGSINLYNVPLRWDSSTENGDESFMKGYTEKVIEEKEVIDIDSGNDQDVIRLIQLLNIH